MKILLISNMYPSKKDPSFGTFVKVFDDGLTELYPKIKVDRVVFKGKAKNWLHKIMKYLFFYINILFKTLYYNYDYIYVHTITYPTPALRISHKFKHLNLIFNVHGVDVLTNSKLAEILKNLSIPLLKDCKYLVVPSSYFKEVVIRHLPQVDKKKIIISPSGGVESIFFSKKKFKSIDTIELGYVSRIIKGKGWETYIKAIKCLIDDGYNIHATIIGGGPQTNQMLSLIEKLNLEKHIDYLGSIGHDKLPKLLQKFELFIFPSENESESLGLVGLEAMASSIPVIGSKIGGIATYIKDNYNGFLFEPKSHSDLTRKIMKYISLSLSEKGQMMNNAYDTALAYEQKTILKELFSQLFKYGTN